MGNCVNSSWSFELYNKIDKNYQFQNAADICSDYQLKDTSDNVNKMFNSIVSTLEKLFSKDADCSMFRDFEYSLFEDSFLKTKDNFKAISGTHGLVAKLFYNVDVMLKWKKHKLWIVFNIGFFDNSNIFYITGAQYSHFQTDVMPVFIPTVVKDTEGYESLSNAIKRILASLSAYGDSGIYESAFITDELLDSTWTFAKSQYTAEREKNVKRKRPFSDSQYIYLVDCFASTIRNEMQVNYGVENVFELISPESYPSKMFRHCGFNLLNDAKCA